MGSWTYRPLRLVRGRGPQSRTAEACWLIIRHMERLADAIGMDVNILEKVTASVAAVIVVVALRWIALRWVRRINDDSDALYRARKIIAYVATIVAVVTLAFIWVDAFDSLGTYLGLVSAGLAIALSDLLKNLAGWAYLLARRPFTVGDRVQVKDLKGDVIDIRLFRFSIMEVGEWVDAEQSSGRLVHVPNGWVFTEDVANYTEGFSHIWDEVPVLITFESDWAHAEQILLSVVRDVAPDVEQSAGQSIRATARRYHIRVGALTPIVYLSVRDSGVLLTARYLVEARDRRRVHDRIWRAMLNAINADPNVALAYPTVRTYLEGPISITNSPGE